MLKFVVGLNIAHRRLQLWEMSPILDSGGRGVADKVTATMRRNNDSVCHRCWSKDRPVWERVAMEAAVGYRPTACQRSDLELQHPESPRVRWVYNEFIGYSTLYLRGSLPSSPTFPPKYPNRSYQDSDNRSYQAAQVHSVMPVSLLKVCVFWRDCGAVCKSSEEESWYSTRCTLPSLC